MRILVTGAGGFLGAAVANRAAAAGHEVLAVVRRSSPRLDTASERLTMRSFDVADNSAVRSVLADWQPDVVVHSAWSGLSGGARRDLGQFSQVETCWRLVQAAADAGIRNFIGIGSQDEVGPREGRVDERVLPTPRSAYGAAKLAACTLAAEVARAHDMRFAWLRLFATFGPGDNSNWLIPSVTRELLAGVAPRTTPGTQRWDYLFIDDAADGVIAAATQPEAQGVFNLSSGSSATVRSIIKRLRDRAAPGLPLQFGEIPFAPGQVMHLEGVNDALRAATGWAPTVPLDEGLDRTVAALAAEHAQAEATKIPNIQEAAGQQATGKA